jgi:hypothetical protein
MWYDHRQVFSEWRKTFCRRSEGSKVSKILRERRRRLEMALYRNTKVARAWMSDMMDRGLGLAIQLRTTKHDNINTDISLNFGAPIKVSGTNFIA